MSQSIFGYRNSVQIKGPMQQLVEIPCPYQVFFPSREGTDEEVGGQGQFFRRQGALLQASPRWGDALSLQEAGDDSCVSGQLSTPSSKKQAFMAKVPGSQTPSSLHNIFTEHRGVG